MLEIQEYNHKPAQKDTVQEAVWTELHTDMQNGGSIPDSVAAANKKTQEGLPQVYIVGDEIADAVAVRAADGPKVTARGEGIAAAGALPVGEADGVAGEKSEKHVPEKESKKHVPDKKLDVHELTQRYLERLDSDENGKISQIEIKAALLSKEFTAAEKKELLLLNKLMFAPKPVNEELNVLNQAFMSFLNENRRAIDRNRDGVVSEAELTRMRERRSTDQSDRKLIDWALDYYRKSFSNETATGGIPLGERPAQSTPGRMRHPQQLHRI